MTGTPNIFKMVIENFGLVLAKTSCTETFKGFKMEYQMNFKDFLNTA